LSLAVTLTPSWAIAYTWVGWIISWFVAAIWSRRTAERPGFAREFPNRLVTVIGAFILFRTLSGADQYFPELWPYNEAFGWVMFACVLAGMAFAWWARLHLGTLWSGTVTRKDDHRVVDTGPYGTVRHPIYTGIIFSLLATALERGRIEPLIGVAIMTIGFWMKARLEEDFLSPHLPDYAAYRARVPMLVPGLKG
jgi:protein-S-isoprenylcysteine O-methyltransferase Ste14